MMAAVGFARHIGTPLNAHATIHWRTKAHPFIRSRRRVQVERALERLIDRHGEGNYLDCTLKPKFPANPNGLYLLKGGGPDVWRKFGVPHCWRKPQSFIHNKRCGVTGSHASAGESNREAPSEKPPDAASRTSRHALRTIRARCGKS